MKMHSNGINNCVLGDNILINPQSHSVYSYSIDIKLYDNSLSEAKANCNASKDYSYSECVDGVVNKELVPVMNCTPPWTSKRLF